MNLVQQLVRRTETMIATGYELVVEVLRETKQV
jgi:hypothetical protein